MSHIVEGPHSTDNSDDTQWVRDLMNILKAHGQNVSISRLENNIAISRIDSTPHGDDPYLMDRHGFIHPFYQKFENGFKGWQPGDRVQTTFRVSQNENGNIELLVADSVTGDVRHADTFELEALTQEQKDTLIQVGMAEVVAIIKVTSYGTNHISNMYRYYAEISNIVHIQPQFDGDFSRLKEHDQVLLEGQVISYKPGEGVHKEFPGECILQTSADQQISVYLWNGYLNFEDGSLPVLNPSYPTVGDTIQIQATFGNPGDRYSIQMPNQLFAYYCRSTYLVKPSAERSHDYDATRRLFTEALHQILSLSLPEEIRNAVAHLIENTTMPDSRQQSKLNTTEISILRNTVTELILEEADRPLDLITEMYVVNELRKVYHADILPMSKSEFYEFCIRVGQGAATIQAEGSCDYHYRLLDQLSPEQQLDILLQSTIHLYSQTFGKRVISRSQYSTSEESGLFTLEDISKDYISWDKKYLTEQTFTYMSGLVSEEVAFLFSEMMRVMMEDELFTKPEDHQNDLEFYEYEIFSAVKHNIYENIELHEDKIISIGDYACAQIYVDQLPMLYDLSHKMQSLAWNNNGRYRVWEYVDEVASILEKVKTFLIRNPRSQPE